MAAKGSVNKVILVGNLGADPESKDIKGTPLTTASLATTETWNKDGETQERVEWHRAVAWRKVGEILANFGKKGDKVYIEGSLQTKSWGDEGDKRYSTEVIVRDMTFLGGAKRESDPAPTPAPVEPTPSAVTADDELPF